MAGNWPASWVRCSSSVNFYDLQIETKVSLSLRNFVVALSVCVCVFFPPHRSYNCYKSAPQYSSAGTHSDLFADVKGHFVYQYTVSFNWLSLTDQISSLQCLYSQETQSLQSYCYKMWIPAGCGICHILCYNVQYPYYIPLNIGLLEKTFDK